MDTLHLSTAVLEWAANKIGLGLADLADAIAPKKQDDFLSGKLTVSQAEKLAKKTETPFGFLFLQTPPEQPDEGIPDLRQVQNADPLSRDFYAVLKDIKRKQTWYSDYLKEIGVDKLDFVGRFKERTDLNPKVVSEDIQKTLNFTEQDRESCSTVADFYSLLYDRIERSGILIFKSGIVKSNSKRGLSVEEFRGFAISDQLAPVIFINGKDAEAAWIFTMVHELAHIWLGESGVSDLRPGKNTDNQSIERFCNRVAAELLTLQHPNPARGAGVHEETLMRYKGNDSADMTDLPLVRT